MASASGAANAVTVAATPLLDAPAVLLMLLLEGALRLAIALWLLPADPVSMALVDPAATSLPARGAERALVDAATGGVGVVSMATGGRKGSFGMATLTGATPGGPAGSSTPGSASASACAMIASGGSTVTAGAHWRREEGCASPGDSEAAEAEAPRLTCADCSWSSVVRTGAARSASVSLSSPESSST